MMVIKNIRMLRVKTPVMTRAMSFKPVYVANVTSTGGRNGKSVSDDKVIKLDLAVPKEMGGPGGAKTNPEQLFAAGYSACFLGAMGAMARDQKLKLPAETTCNALIGIGADPAGGFQLGAELKVHIPGFEKAAALKLVQAAHEFCPYSKATRGNIDVKLTIV